jgi:GH15 family glucan-1,4-alpha-glucosidase
MSQYIAVDIFWVSHAVPPSNPFIQHANAKYIVFNVVFQFDRLTQILFFLSFTPSSPLLMLSKYQKSHFNMTWSINLLDIYDSYYIIASGSESCLEYFQILDFNK